MVALLTQQVPDRWHDTAQALRVGVALQLVCLVLPLLDLWFFGSVEGHVRDAYPRWDDADVAQERNAIVGYLVALGVLGLAGWLVALLAARRDRAVRATVTGLFVAGITVLAVTAGAGGAEYERIVPLWLGLTLLCVLALPGVTALAAVWTRGSQD